MKPELHSKILLVDDETSVLRALSRVLTYAGYQVVTSSCPKDALAMVKTQSFDVIIADYRMPEMNGVAFLRKSRPHQPFACHFILSGDADIDDVIECMNDDVAERFLRKPWDNKRLLDEVSIGVEKRRKNHLLSVAMSNQLQMQHSNESADFSVITSSTANGSQAHASQNNELLERLKSAIFEDEFSLVYQPKVCAKTGRIVGLESLLRWTSAGYGSVSPEIFIPVAEEEDLIQGIGEWVLRETARFQMRWQAFTLLDGFKLAFNVSPKQLHDDKFVDVVKALIAEGNLVPENLCVEITESAAIEDFDGCCKQLKRLEKLGIDVAIDDFGTGHTAINYLLNLPAQVVKIDRSLIAGVDSEEKCYNVVKNLVSMAQSIGMKVVAEGIEVSQHALCLRDMGCEELQGYHYSKPLAEEPLLKVLAQQPYLF